MCFQNGTMNGTYDSAITIWKKSMIVVASQKMIGLILWITSKKEYKNIK